MAPLERQERRVGPGAQTVERRARLRRRVTVELDGGDLADFREARHQRAEVRVVREPARRAGVLRDDHGDAPGLVQEDRVVERLRVVLADRAQEIFGEALEVLDLAIADAREGATPKFVHVSSLVCGDCWPLRAAWLRFRS